MMQNTKRHNMLRLLAYFKPYVGWVILGIILAFVLNVAELANPYIMKIVIDDYIVGGNRSVSIVALGLAYLGAVLIGAVCSFIQVVLLNSIGQKIMHTIRVELFSHIQRMPLSFFDRNSSGRIVTRMTNDVEALSELFSGVLVALFRDIIMLIGIVVVMVELNVKLTLVSMCVIPIIIVVAYLYNMKAKPNFRRVRALVARINGFFAENIQGMKLVQVFHREKEKYQEFEKLNDEYNKASILEVILVALFRPSAELINNLAITILIWVCTPGIFNGVVEIGVLYAFITYVKRFFGPINDLVDKYNVIQSGSVAAERIFEILDNNEGLENLDEGMELKEVRGEIEFKNVWFSYNNKDWVLKDISFKINPGETVAFVGATGSGKSTIINLMGRFYEIQKGEILLDGINIRDIKLRDLRRCIAVVMQDVFLFSGDIKSNIRLNSTEISDEDVIKAAKYANAHEFIQSLPDKYDEEVKERGCTLSAGQRQLISFARAIAYNPSILVLDEATANIDTETEKIIQESLERISKDRTTVVIAHRLSTIQKADKIIVLHKGRIREMGKHDELLKLGGIYKNLYDMQFIGEEPARSLSVG